MLILLVACAPDNGPEPDPNELRRRVEQEYGIPAGGLVELRDGSRITFFGDSITVGGAEDTGYVTRFEEAIQGLYPNRTVEVRASGVVGDTVPDLARRLARDVLSHKPTHVVIYVGVNDAAGLGPGAAAVRRGVEAYRRGLTGLVEQLRAAGAWVMVCTPAVIGEDVDQDSGTNRTLDEYAAAARDVAAETGAGLCDLRREFTDHLSARNRSGADRGLLTVDGIHLNAAGHRLVAGTMLRALVTTATPAPVPQPLIRTPPAAPRPVRTAPVSRPPAAPPPPAAPAPVVEPPPEPPAPTEEPAQPATPSAAPSEEPSPTEGPLPDPTDPGEPIPEP